MATWHEQKPVATDPLSEFPSVMTDQAIAFREAVEKYSFWTDASGASAGIPRLSDGSAGPGVARAFYGTASSLSTALSASKPLAGRLFVTSDTHRLYGFPSSTSTTVQLGAEQLVVYYGPSATTMVSNTRVLVQSSSASIVINSRNTIAFPTSYTGTPTVQLQAGSTVTTDLYQPVLLTSGTTNFALTLARLIGSLNTATIFWRSHGTVTL